MRELRHYSKSLSTVVDEITKQIEEFGAKFEGPAVIGISGGKDSAVAAALCVDALGKDRVYGVIMPNGEMNDFRLAKLVCECLGIQYTVINIKEPWTQISEAANANEYAKMNLAPRLRMATLYAVSQSKQGWVVNTSNADEMFLGYFTMWGDGVGDFYVLQDLHASEVEQIGTYYRAFLPGLVIHKAPADGLSDKTDEEKWGFTYKDVEEVMDFPNSDIDPEIRAKINSMNERTGYKFSRQGVRLHFKESWEF